MEDLLRKRSDSFPVIEAKGIGRKLLFAGLTFVALVSEWWLVRCCPTIFHEEPGISSEVKTAAGIRTVWGNQFYLIGTLEHNRKNLQDLYSVRDELSLDNKDNHLCGVRIFARSKKQKCGDFVPTYLRTFKSFSLFTLSRAGGWE